MKHNFCIIMAGGIGSRFWPMSRTSHPKQFIDILGTGTTLIQQTFERFVRVCPPENILVVTNSIYKNLVLEQLPQISEQQVLCEPSRRNTAPCACTAARVAIGAVAPTVLLVQEAADALIGTKVDEAALDMAAEAVRAACKPIDDKRSSAAYRIRISGTIFKRAAQTALSARSRAGPNRQRASLQMKLDASRGSPSPSYCATSG